MSLDVKIADTSRRDNDARRRRRTSLSPAAGDAQSDDLRRHDSADRMGLATC